MLAPDFEMSSANDSRYPVYDALRPISLMRKSGSDFRAISYQCVIISKVFTFCYQYFCCMICPGSVSRWQVLEISSSNACILFRINFKNQMAQR